MRYLPAFVFLFFSYTISAQCTTLVRSKYDRISGQTIRDQITAITANNELKKPSIKIQMWSLNDAGLFFNIHTIPVSCVLDDAKVYILFTDSTRLELENEADMNCTGHLSVSFNCYDDKDKNLQLFINKKVEAIRVNSYNKTFDGYFTQAKQDAFTAALNCLITKN